MGMKPGHFILLEMYMLIMVKKRVLRRIFGNGRDHKQQGH
jgi:hypothetical protein